MIIPVRNGEKFLERCFSTIENQTYSNLEIIFIDNNSNDSSTEKINQYLKKNSSAMLLSCKEQGPSHARNLGINRSNGDFISFLDVDDELHPQKHEILLAKFMKSPLVGMAVGNYKKQFSKTSFQIINHKVGDQDLNNPPTYAIQWLNAFNLCPSTNSVLISRKVFNDVGNFPVSLRFGEDLALFIKIALKYEIAFVDDIISTYHRHKHSSISKSNAIRTPAERYKLFYEKFALEYFYKSNQEEHNSLAYKVVQENAFKLYMSMIFDKNIITLEQIDLPDKYFSKLKRFLILYKSLPFRLASKIFHVIYKK